jgi:hypothetical protein
VIRRSVLFMTNMVRRGSRGYRLPAQLGRLGLQVGPHSSMVMVPLHSGSTLEVLMTYLLKYLVIPARFLAWEWVGDEVVDPGLGCFLMKYLDTLLSVVARDQ